MSSHTITSREPGSGPGRMLTAVGVVADELHCSRSDRSSREVALVQVSRPLSVVVGLEMEEPALSEADRLEVDEPCSMNKTPPDEEEIFIQ